jgi:hypothetical protein
MTVEEAIDCVNNQWNTTCCVGHKEAANILVAELLRLREVNHELRNLYEPEDDDHDFLFENDEGSYD